MKTMTTNYNDEGIRRLAIAIVRFAVDDYKNMARNQIRRAVNDDGDIHRKTSGLYALERFFYSEWCYTLCGVDGGAIMRELKRYLEGYIGRNMQGVR